MVPIITTGSRTSVSDGQITIDASSSRDPDIDPSVVDHGISFTWTCVQIAPDYGDPCDVPTLANNKTITVDSTFEELLKHKFTVTIQKGDRTRSASTTIEFLSSGWVSASALVSSSTFSNAQLVNPTDSFRVASEIVTTVTVHAEWQLASGILTSSTV